VKWRQGEGMEHQQLEVALERVRAPTCRGHQARRRENESMVTICRYLSIAVIARSVKVGWVGRGGAPALRPGPPETR
jgi:hypothetical protein